MHSRYIFHYVMHFVSIRTIYLQYVNVYILFPTPSYCMSVDCRLTVVVALGMRGVQIEPWPRIEMGLLLTTDCSSRSLLTSLEILYFECCYDREAGHVTFSSVRMTLCSRGQV